MQVSLVFTLQVKDFESAGKFNEQFEGKLMATVDDMMLLTITQRLELGITDPSEEELKRMTKHHEKKFIRKVRSKLHAPY